jgi:hypothetical protein
MWLKRPGEKKMSEAFASYKKEVETTWVKTTHRVRVRVGASAEDIRYALKHVPGRAIVQAVADDQEHDEFKDCGEIVFTEECQA